MLEYGEERSSSIKVMASIGAESDWEIGSLRNALILYCVDDWSFTTESAFALFAVFEKMFLVLFPILVLHVPIRFGPRSIVIEHLNVIEDFLFKYSLVVHTLDLAIFFEAHISSITKIAYD